MHLAAVFKAYRHYAAEAASQHHQATYMAVHDAQHCALAPYTCSHSQTRSACQGAPAAVPHLPHDLELLQHGVAGDQQVVLDAQLRDGGAQHLRPPLALRQPRPLPLPEPLLRPPAGFEALAYRNCDTYIKPGSLACLQNRATRVSHLRFKS